MRIWHDKNTHSPCHPCYISEYVYLHTFHVIFLLRHVSCGHRISCPSHHMVRTVNKAFSALIGPRHMTTRTAMIHYCSMIHYCYCLMVSGKWYKNINITHILWNCNWKKRIFYLMLTFNSDFQNCQRFALFLAMRLNIRNIKTYCFLSVFKVSLISFDIKPCRTFPNTV